MKRSPIALALVAALGVGFALPSAPVLAQANASTSIRTGSSSIGGTFGVRLAVYDARSFELSWNRIPNAVTYRVQVGSRTVQDNGAVSRYVSGVGLAGGFDYTLTALDRSGSTLATQRFRVQPASGTQLVAAGGTSAPSRPTDIPPAPQDLRARLYSSSAGEVFWQRLPGALLSYEIRLGGSVVATTDGTSYFIGNRPGLSGASVEVVAISRPTGRRSSASSVTLGSGTTSNPTTPTNPMAPVAPTAPDSDPIRTGVSNIGGAFPVRLNVYDAQSFELSWQRVPGAALYRLSRGGQVVQESNGLSRYVSGIDSSASFAYTLVALDRTGTALRATSFTVAPRAGMQLVAGDGSAAPTTPMTPTVPEGPDTPAGPGSAFIPTALATPLLAPIGPGSALSVANYQTFLPAFYGIADPTLLTTIRRQTDRIQSELEMALSGASSPFVAESITSTQGGADDVAFACPGGGEVRAVLAGAGTPTAGSTMDFRRCKVGADTLSGVTREVPGAPGDSFDLDRTFGGFDAEIRLYPFMRETPGFGTAEERFTVETEAGFSTSVYAAARRFTAAASDGDVLANERWRGNWQLEGTDATLLVTELYTDTTRYLETNDEADRVKPYFLVSGTVTNDRPVRSVNQSDFAYVATSSFGTSGQQAFNDARGGILNIINVPDFESRSSRFDVRIDTAGIVLRQPIPAGLDPTRTLFGR